MNEADGNFTAHCPSTSSTTGYVAWIGIGGDGPLNTLWQAGWDANGKAPFVESIVNGHDNGLTDLPGLLTTHLCSTATQETFYVDINYGRHYTNGAYAFIEDNSTSSGGEVPQDYEALQTSIDTSTVEWIDERPTGPNGPLTLANYGTDSWSGCHMKFTGNNLWYNLNQAGSVYQMNMYRSCRVTRITCQPPHQED